MPLTERVKLAIIREVFEKGVFDAKKLMEINREDGIFTMSGLRSIVVGTLSFAILHEAAGDEYCKFEVRRQLT